MFVHVRLHHDNAPIHTSKLPYPQYYPDLANCDLFLFPKFKKCLYLVVVPMGTGLSHQSVPQRTSFGGINLCVIFFTNEINNYFKFHHQ